RRHGGMGIGLSLVKQLIELHGGTVAASSTYGQGARFTIELPAAKYKEVSSGFPTQSERGLLSHMRIFIVDDSADTVDMLRRLFEMDGAVVATDSGAAAALRIAAAEYVDVM